MARQKIYLVLTKKRYSSLSVRATAKKPTTKGNEIAIGVDIEIPDALFEKPQLEAKIKVDPSKMIGGLIPVDIATNIAEEIQRQTGLNVTISVAAEDVTAKNEIINSFGS